jgi:hypothetical protein
MKILPLICGLMLLAFPAYATTTLYSNSSSVGIGTTSPAASLDISQETDALALPSGTTAQRPGSPVAGEIRYNSSTPDVEAYIGSSWTSLSGGGGSSFQSSAGQLECSGGNCNNSTGSSSIQYCPYKGNIKTTASQGNYTIPSVCLTATFTSMYVGGVASSSLSANTLYYIYLWNASGTWVLDAETTGHVTDSTSGIEIMSGDDTKTLVGMIETDANTHVMTGGETNTPGDTNTVATWDNRSPTTTTCYAAGGAATVNYTTRTEVDSTDRCLFMSWGDSLQFSSQQTALAQTSAGFDLEIFVFLDSTSTQVSETLNGWASDGWKLPVTSPAAFTPSEGFHTSLFYAAIQVLADTASLNGEVNTFQTLQ